MRNVLVTGANGFIGRSLCERLLADGYQVRWAVRGQEKTEVGCLRSAVYAPHCRGRKLRRAKDVGGLRVMVGDIGTETDWSKALDGIDGIVHLGGIGDAATNATKVRYTTSEIRGKDNRFFLNRRKRR